ncbi:MAG: PhzF family phenazine biosynthesis protein [Hyphomicrobiaceae bacterium]
MKLEFHTLDVFTDERFAGNPLAVVLGADQLDAAQMQRVAREFNLSETVFVMKPEDEKHSARVRIFTPAAEIPFAGHPTIGTAALLAELRSLEVGSGSTALIALEENIGVVRVGARMAGNAPTFAEFDAPKLPIEVGVVPSRDELASAVGLLSGEIGYANHQPTRFSAGADFTFIPVTSLDSIGKAVANVTHWGRIFVDDSTVGAFLYTHQTTHGKSHYHARMFAPSHGILEDPATGSAAAAFAGVIARFDQPGFGLHKRQIEQGIEMGRPSFISLSLDIKDDGLATVRIGGHAVRVTKGEIEI